MCPLVILPLRHLHVYPPRNFPIFTTDQNYLTSSPRYGCIRAPAPTVVYTVYLIYIFDNEQKEMTQILPRDRWEKIIPGTQRDAILEGFEKSNLLQGLMAIEEMILE